MKLQRWQFLWVLVMLFSVLNSCEKNIDFEVKTAEDVLVVDAQIESGLAPIVILSKSYNYFTTLDLQTVADKFVRNAKVTISNGGITHTLKEYALPLGGSNSAYYYTNDDVNTTFNIYGQFGASYVLTIEAEGKVYTATTTIPFLNKVPDSVYFKKVPNNPDTTLRSLMVKLTDPPGLGNYIRYYTGFNNGPLWPGGNSVFPDDVIDGTTYEIEVEPGIDRTKKSNDQIKFFTLNDSATVKMCNINQSTYKFWSTWEFARQSIGNPFAQPNKVIGNISNGALGAFCGYAAWYKKLKVR
jgi:hypothetical protein